MNTSHYPSLELCKKLTAIGFPKTKEYAVDYHWDFVEDDNLVCPSVMEMLDVMPKDIHVLHNKYTWNITPYWFTYAPNQSHSTNEIPFFATNISDDSDCLSIDPNSLAQMILWLYENNYISFSK